MSRIACKIRDPYHATVRPCLRRLPARAGSGGKRMWVGSACVRAFDSWEASTNLKITNLARPGLGCAHHPILSPYWGALSLAIGSNSWHHSFGNMFTVAFSFLIFPVKAPNNHTTKYEVNFWGGLQDEWKQDSPRLQTTPFLRGWGDSLGQQQANLGVNWERRIWCVKDWL